ncbi:MAG: hypothetical protein IBX64_12265 [Actinobacteria bacterium]|nr:hypothetical protein [Actinomycetota bacterium]
MHIDLDAVFQAIEERCKAGLLLQDIKEKVDYDKQAKEELIKLKAALGCESLSVDEFISLYKKKAGIGH